MSLVLRIDTAQIARLANAFGAIGPAKTHTVLRRAINHTGMKARTAMIRALVSQTGLKRKTLVAALRVTRATGGALSFEVRSRGGDISLKYLSPRETRRGVAHKSPRLASPVGSAFLRGGRWSRRVPLQMGGHVFRRTGQGRVPIALVDSGVIIPQEMVSGASEAAFFRVAEAELPERIAHELYRLLPG